MAERAFTLPLQALEPIPVDGEDSLLLMLLNPTGGLVGGDRLTTSVHIGADAHVCLTTPSATKIYRTLGPPAIQHTMIDMGPNAVLEYVPEHVIPYPGSAFEQSLDIEMKPGSRAIIYDAFAVGRLARGERWRFREVTNQMSVRFDRKLLFYDHMKLLPSVQAFAELQGRVEFGYCATLVLISDRVPDWGEVVRCLEERLRPWDSVFAGVSALSQHGCVVRSVTGTAHDCVAVSHSLWTLSRRILLGRLALNLGKW